VREIARDPGIAPAQVALAGLRQIDPSGRMMPIVGASSVAQLQTEPGYLDLTLDAEQIARLDAISRINMGYPANSCAATLSAPCRPAARTISLTIVDIRARLTTPFRHSRRSANHYRRLCPKASAANALLNWPIAPRVCARDRRPQERAPGLRKAASNLNAIVLSRAATRARAWVPNILPPMATGARTAC